MKAQSSIEFIALLSLTLLASSVLLDALNDKAILAERQSRAEEAQYVAQNTAYRLNLLMSARNSSTKLRYSDNLKKNYTVKIKNGYVIVDSQAGPAISRTVYNKTSLTFGTRNGKEIRLQEGEGSD
ncbi:hypothetical protein GLU64_03340 [Nanohaloarchaea archaeon]|nr:hypothetical protein [Candidatus Nanohaloarchaea archaeon]